MDVKENGVGQFADFGEAGFCALMFGAGAVGLPQGEDGDDDEERERGGGGEGGCHIAAEKETDAVGGVVGEGGDGLVIEMFAKVVSELGGGLVAVLGIAAEGAEENGVEFSFQVLGEESWVAVPILTDEDGVAGDLAAAIGELAFGSPENGLAGWLGLALGEGANGFERCIIADLVGTMAS